MTKQPDPLPRTEAGRRLLASEGVLPLFIGVMAEDDHVLRDFIIAIEDESAALHVTDTPAPDPRYGSYFDENEGTDTPLTLCFEPGCTLPGHISRVHEATE